MWVTSAYDQYTIQKIALAGKGRGWLEHMLASFEHTSMCWRKRIAPTKCSIRRWAQRFPVNAKMSVSPRSRARLCQNVVVRPGETPFFSVGARRPTPDQPRIPCSGAPRPKRRRKQPRTAHLLHTTSHHTTLQQTTFRYFALQLHSDYLRATLGMRDGDLGTT